MSRAIPSRKEDFSFVKRRVFTVSPGRAFQRKIFFPDIVPRAWPPGTIFSTRISVAFSRGSFIFIIITYLERIRKRW